MDGERPANADADRPADAAGDRPADAAGERPADGDGERQDDMNGEPPANADGGRVADVERGREEPLIVVDGANVVGSVPDGWWRDRRGAATRLRDALAARDAATLPPPLLGAVTLVVEGAARGVPPVAGVHVEAAPRSGDDHIVALVADNVGHRPVVVVTADRELRERVRELGASIVSPGELRASIPYGGRQDSI